MVFPIFSNWVNTCGKSRRERLLHAVEAPARASFVSEFSRSQKNFLWWKIYNGGKSNGKLGKL